MQKKPLIHSTSIVKMKYKDFVYRSYYGEGFEILRHDFIGNGVLSSHIAH